MGLVPVFLYFLISMSNRVADTLKVLEAADSFLGGGKQGKGSRSRGGRGGRSDQLGGYGGEGGVERAKKARGSRLEGSERDTLPKADGSVAPFRHPGQNSWRGCFRAAAATAVGPATSSTAGTVAEGGGDGGGAGCGGGAKETN
ncbi:hypothetical protein V8C42DRAFT_24232 [Trichoderma barbatum]